MKSIKKIALHCSRTKLAEAQAPYSKRVAHSAAVASILRSLLGHEDQEVFLSLHLDAKNRVIGYTEVARGSISECAIAAREVFRTAIVNGAGSIIIAHNHPSGDPTPSDSDVAMTRRLRRASDILGIPVLDHVIIGDTDRYFSFLDSGLLKDGGES